MKNEDQDIPVRRVGVEGWGNHPSFTGSAGARLYLIRLLMRTEKTYENPGVRFVLVIGRSDVARGLTEELAESVVKDRELWQNVVRVVDEIDSGACDIVWEIDGLGKIVPKSG